MKRIILKISIQYGYMDIMGNKDRMVRMVSIVHYGPNTLQGHSRGFVEILDNTILMGIYFKGYG